MNGYKFLKLSVLLCVLPAICHAQHSISGKFNSNYNIFLPADTNIFVKRFTGSTSIFTYQDKVYLDDGLLKFRKSGLVDSAGKIIAEPIYEEVRTTDDSIFIVH